MPEPTRADEPGPNEARPVSTDAGRGTPTDPGRDSRPEPVIRAGRWAPGYRVVGLFFVAYPLIALASSHPDPTQVALVLAADAIFLALIAVGGNLRADDPRRHRWPIAGVLALVVLSTAIALRQPNFGWVAMFYYASTSAVVVMPASVAARLMAVAGLGAGTTLYVQSSDGAAGLVQGISVAVIGLVLLSSTELRRTNAQLVAAREELATLAVQEERNRIARDLHDILGHSLSIIALKSELARRVLATDPERAAGEIADVERVARDALGSVRETVSGYRQPTLAIELAGARSALAAAGIEGRVEPPPDGLPPGVDAMLAWAVREGVTNIVRHSGAERAEITVERGAGSAAVAVVDDGARRADDAAAPGRASAGVGPAGSGLAGLRERVARVGGSVEAAPLPGRGFRLFVSVPLDAL